MFNPQRLTLARTRRGITKKALAEEIGVTLRCVSAYEAGSRSPSDDGMARIARALQFPPDFFSAGDAELPDVCGVSFRSLRAMTAAQRDAALGSAALAVELDRWIEREFERPKSDLPLFKGYSPERAADEIRVMWGLGEKPIKNVVHLLESHGVRVFSLAERGREVDAFSFWRGEVPYVFLNTGKSAEHGRFDASHELAHLILHRHGGPGGRVAEREADAFASAFLMPYGSVVAAAPRIPDVSSLIRLKAKWGVSVAALNYRMHACRLTTDYQNRMLCIEIARRGYRMAEPEPTEWESSQAMEKVFESLRLDGVTKQDVARALRIDPSELDVFVFGRVLRFISGESRPAPPHERGKPTLRILGKGHAP